MEKIKERFLKRKNSFVDIKTLLITTTILIISTIISTIIYFIIDN